MAASAAAWSATPGPHFRAMRLSGKSRIICNCVWTTTAPNGAHVLAAIARDAGGNVATSAGVTVTVANITPPLPNLPAVPQLPPPPVGLPDPGARAGDVLDYLLGP